MTPKRISTSAMGIWILLLSVGAMAWQVAPASAGFTPTPATDRTRPSRPTDTSIPPTEHAHPADRHAHPADRHAHPADRPRPSRRPTRPSRRPTRRLAGRHARPIGHTPSPLLPVTGGQASGLNNSGIVIVLLAGVMVFLLVALSLVIRQSARTKNGK